MLPAASVFRQIARPSFCYLLLTSSLHPRLDFRTTKTNFCQAYPTQCLASKAAMTTDTGSATPQQYTYRWPRPSVTVDLLIFTVEASKVWVLLIQRKAEPFQGSWALPGGFVDENEALEVAAGRELQEETGVEDLALAQVGAFGEPGRDPRGHTITVAYMAFAPGRECGVRAGDDASDARWFAVDSLPPLAFDHKKILESAWGRLLVVPSTEGDGGHVAIERGSGKVLTTLSKPEHAEALAATKPAQM